MELRGEVLSNKMMTLVKILLCSFLMSFQFAMASMKNSGSHLPPIDKDLLLILGIQRGLEFNRLDLCNLNMPAVWSTNPCKLKSYIKRFSQLGAENRVLSRISDQDKVVYFGETHTNQQAKIFLRNILAGLKEKGFSVLALEMFNIDQQNVLDGYFSGNISREKLKQSLLSDWNYKAEEYLNLIEEARKLGIRPLAIDNRSLVETRDFVEGLHQRDQIMAEKISSFLMMSSDVKIIVLAGSLHAQYFLNRTSKIPSQIELLEKLSGIRALSFTLLERFRSARPLPEIYAELMGGDFELPVYLPLNGEFEVAPSTEAFVLLP